MDDSNLAHVEDIGDHHLYTLRNLTAYTLKEVSLALTREGLRICTEDVTATRIIAE